MLRFLAKLLLFLAIVFAVCAAIYKAIPPSQDVYLAALVDKHARLDSLTLTGTPKIILVGGSNVAFGLNSRRIEQALGMPVLNMSVHASLRHEYHLNEVAPSLGKGDLVLIFPEYSQIYRPLSEGNPILYQSFEVFPQGMNYVKSQGHLKLRVNAAVEILQVKVKRLIARKMGMGRNLDYKRNIFDAWGDIWTPETLKSKYKKEDRHISLDRGEPVSPDFVELTNAFVDDAEKKGARVLLGFPAIAEAKYDSMTAYDTRDQLERLVHARVINAPGDYVYADTLFYDSKYHTTQAGREIRTTQFIADLRVLLDKGR